MRTRARVCAYITYTQYTKVVRPCVVQLFCVSLSQILILIYRFDAALSPIVGSEVKGRTDGAPVLLLLLPLQDPLPFQIKVAAAVREIMEKAAARQGGHAATRLRARG